MIAPLHIVGRADMNAIAGVVGAQRAVLIVEERIEVEVEDRFAVRQLRDGGVALVDDLVFEVGAIRLLLRGVEDDWMKMTASGCFSRTRSSSDLYWAAQSAAV